MWRNIIIVGKNVLGGGKRDSGIEFLKISAVILIIISHVVQTLGTPNSYVLFQDYVISLDTATQNVQTSYSRLNPTSSVSIFQMTLTSLLAQCPRAVVGLACRSLGIVISLEIGIVFNNIADCIHKGIDRILMKARFEEIL